jgi:ribosome-binding factor A
MSSKLTGANGSASLPRRNSQPLSALYSPMTRRTEQINSLLREEISSVISRDLKDPRLSAMVSITDVDTSPDLGRATVFVSLLGAEDEADETFAALRSAAPYIHHQLRERLSLRKVPAISFRRDESIERGARLSRMIDEAVKPSGD